MSLLHREKRWAIAVTTIVGRKLLGPRCWPGAWVDEPRVRTFRTRQLARVARMELSHYGQATTRVIAVELVCEEMEVTA